jgi:hypothetical protein
MWPRFRSPLDMQNLMHSAPKRKSTIDPQNSHLIAGLVWTLRATGTQRSRIIPAQGAPDPVTLLSPVQGAQQHGRVKNADKAVTVQDSERASVTVCCPSRSNVFATDDSRNGRAWIQIKDTHPPKIHCKEFEDNSGALEMANVHRLRPRTKHLAVSWQHFCHHVTNGDTTILPVIDTEDQIPDCLTKSNNRVTLRRHPLAIVGWQQRILRGNVTTSILVGSAFHQEVKQVSIFTQANANCLN